MSKLKRALSSRNNPVLLYEDDNISFRIELFENGEDDFKYTLKNKNNE